MPCWPVRKAARPAVQLLLAVVVEEARCPPCAMRSMFGVVVAHQAVAVGADVGDADVVAEDDEDVRLVPCSRLSWARAGLGAAAGVMADAAARAEPPRSRLRRFRLVASAFRLVSSPVMFSLCLRSLLIRLLLRLRPFAVGSGSAIQSLIHFSSNGGAFLDAAGHFFGNRNVARARAPQSGPPSGLVA